MEEEITEGGEREGEELNAQEGDWRRRLVNEDEAKLGSTMSQGEEMRGRTGGSHSGRIEQHV